MGIHSGPGMATKELKTFALLDQIVSVLGSTKSTFFPFLESTGGSLVEDPIRSYKNNAHDLISRDEAGVLTLEAQFSPYMHVGGVHSYDFDAASQQYLFGTADTNTGFPSNADFSVGAWIYPRDITSVTILSKYDVANKREWRMMLDGSSKVSLEVLDETEGDNGTRIGASDTAVATDIWSFVVATTDNNDDDLAQIFYINGAADGSGNSLTGTYNDSPDSSGELTIGATLNTAAAVTALFEGRIALPFVTGKELTAANVSTLYGIGKTLLGL